MTKNPFKLKIIDDLPFFGDITSFLNFKDSSFKRIAWALWQKALTISITFLSFVEIELLYRQDRFFKPLEKSVFDYRIRTRTLITTNCKKLNSIQFVIAFFPFIFTFSFCLRSRYKEQLFSYLVKDTLPGIGVSHQDLSWETFREIYSKKIISFPDKFSNISTQKYQYFVSKTEDQIEVVNLADSNRKILSNENEKEGASSMLLKPSVLTSLKADSASPSILPANKGVDKNKGDVVFVNSSIDSSPLEFGTEGNEAYASKSIFSPSLLSFFSGKDTHQTSYGVESRKIPSLYEYLKQTGLLRIENEGCTFNNGSASTDRFASHAEEKYQEKDEKLRNQDFIERLDVSSNLILLEMKPAWEQKQKQFYIGFLPKKNQISLNKLPLFFDRKQKVGCTSSMRLLTAHSKKEIVHISNVPLQIKNTKNNNKEKVYAHKFYARKQNLLRSYKDKISLKTTLINKKPNLINLFSKQQFQQKLFDLDELPLKLDQNYSEVLSSKIQENQENLKLNILNPLSTLSADRESLIIPTPNLFETLQTFPNPLFTSDLLRFSSNKERKIHNIENGVADQTKLLNISSEEKDSGPESEEKDSGSEGEEKDSGSESEEKDSGSERLLLPNEPTQIEDQKPIFIKELLENFDKDGEEETFYKKIFLENELKKFFYNEEFFASTPLDPTYSFTNLKQTFSAQRGVSAFKVRTEELDLFDSIQALILNLEKNHISLNLGALPEQSGLISSRLLSGYSYPDMEITNLRSSRIQKFYKNLIFQKQDKERLSMKIELPSSFLTDPFESDESEPNQKKGNPTLTVHSEGPCFPNLENPEVCLNFDYEGFFPFASTNKNSDKSRVQPKGFAQSSSGAKEHFASHEGVFVRAFDTMPFYEDSFFCESEDPKQPSLPDKNEGYEGDYFSMGDDGDEGDEGDEWYAGYEADEGYELFIQRGGTLSSLPAAKGVEGVEGAKGYELFVRKKAPETHKIGNLLKVPQLKFHYLPTSQTLLNKSCLLKLNISGIYQKVPTIYKQEINLSSKPFALLPLSLWGDISSFVRISLGRDVRPIIKNSFFESPSRGVFVFLKPLLYTQKPFRDYWEPVTLQSWLVITKLSFAFLTLKFFQNFILNEGKFLLRFLSEKLKEELGLTDNKKDKGYRLIKKVQKRFKDVAGIDNILPELGEMVWVLRNSGRSFKVGRVLPKGFLFVGPPGTGKTLLVQAIAGEAEVPVLVQSGSSLTDAGENEKGAQRLKKLFEQARKVAPCIVFIDEIDTLGESRQNVMSNNVGADDLIQSLHQSHQGLTEKSSSDFVTKSKDKAGNLTEKKSREGLKSKNLKNSSFSLSEDLQHNSYLSITKKNQAKQEANQEQLNLLMQFLVELDGLKSRAGIIVIGATNRPKVLDPALTRPGRFDRVLSLEFPGKTKRIEILKLYSQNIGIIYGETKKQISSTTEQAKPKESFSYISNTNHAFGDQDFAWEYLANRTFGFSAADLAAAMNLSSIQAILRNTGHTIETIEQGIESITTYSIKKPKIERTTEKDPCASHKYTCASHKDPFFITLFAYYQAGKAVLHTLLPQHPDAIVLKLWPQPKNSRHKNVNLQLTSWSLNHRAKLETRLIGLYAGKAAELVALSLNSQTKKQTKTTNTRKTTSTIKENKGPNRKTVSLLRTKNALRNRYVITSPKQNLTNQDLRKPKSSSFFKASILTSLPYSNPAARGKYQEKQGLLKSKILKSKSGMRLLAAHRLISDLSPSTIKTKQITLQPMRRQKAHTASAAFAPLFDKNVVFVSRGIRLQAKSFDVSGEIKQKNQQVHSQYNKRNLWHSSLGIEDLSVASNLAHSLVEKWHFYSNKIAIRGENQIFTNQNIVEISETGVFELFQQLTEDVQNRISASNISESTEKKQSEGRDKHSRYNFQEWSIRPWWQNVITEQTGNLNMFYDDWYRIYLPDPEESERNDEWVTPDQYYHNTQNLKNLLPKSSYRKKKYLLPTFKNLTNPKIPGVSKPKNSLPYSNPAARGKYQEKQDLLKSKILKSGMRSQAARRGFISELNNNKRKIDQATATKLNILNLLSKTSAFNSHVKEKNNRSKNKNKPFEGPRREFLFKNRQIKNKLNFDVTWNDLYKLDRDYIYHALILTCFNKAFSLLDENRELLDYLADYLMRFETLRQHKIKQIFYDFGYSFLPNESLIKKE